MATNLKLFGVDVLGGFDDIKIHLIFNRGEYGYAAFCNLGERELAVKKWLETKKVTPVFSNDCLERVVYSPTNNELSQFWRARKEVMERAQRNAEISEQLKSKTCAMPVGGRGVFKMDLIPTLLERVNGGVVNAKSLDVVFECEEF